MLLQFFHNVLGDTVFETVDIIKMMPKFMCDCGKIIRHFSAYTFIPQIILSACMSTANMPCRDIDTELLLYAFDDLC